MAKTASELMREGGNWLGAVRGWMQWNKLNGSEVIWNSDDELRPPVTVRQLEDAAATAVAADRVDPEKFKDAAKEYARAYADWERAHRRGLIMAYQDGFKRDLQTKWRALLAMVGIEEKEEPTHAKVS